ncbi:MAG: hypothetical protein WBA77_09145 [Microcoleaceae cyanobacterium]
MLASIMQMRLQQLEDNVVRVLQLLNDYEVELLDESDPGTKNKYSRRIEQLKQQRDNYERELTAIEKQLMSEPQEEQLSKITSQLQQIDKKLDWLTDSQAAIHQAILVHFTTEEKALIYPIARQLQETQRVEVESVLEAVESNQVSEEETKLIVDQLKQALVLLKKEGLELPSDNKEIIEILNSPTLDAKHALKVSIPIIPFILSYEGELGLGTGIKLKETWNQWKEKFLNK